MLSFHVGPPCPALNGPGDTRSSSAAITLAFACRELELGSLDALDFEHLLILVPQGASYIPQVTGESPHAVWLQRGRMIGAFPGPIEREVTLDPLGLERHGGHVGGDPQVVSGETDRLDSAVEFLLEPRDVQEAQL